MKRYISAILISCLLIQLFGCYSFQNISTEELNSIDDIEDISITTKDSNNYSFEKYSSANRMLNDPTKYYYENWQVNNDTLMISGYSLENTTLKTSKKINHDKIIIPFVEISDLSQNQFNSHDTIMAVLACLTPILLTLAAILTL